MKTKDLDKLRKQGKLIGKALHMVSELKDTPKRIIEMYDNTEINRPLDPEMESAFEIEVTLPQGNTHVQEPFTVSTIEDSKGYWHWFINLWFYATGETNDLKIIKEQRQYVSQLYELHTDINICYENDDSCNFNKNGSWDDSQDFFQNKADIATLIH